MKNNKLSMLINKIFNLVLFGDEYKLITYQLVGGGSVTKYVKVK